MDIMKQRTAAINHVILIAKMCISKYRYGKYFESILFIRKRIKFDKCIIISINCVHRQPL